MNDLSRSVDDVLAQLKENADRIVADLSPHLKRSARPHIEIMLRDRLSELTHDAVREGANLGRAAADSGSCHGFW
jgi:hypothetical protein